MLSADTLTQELARLLPPALHGHLDALAQLLLGLAGRLAAEGDAASASYSLTLPKVGAGPSDLRVALAGQELRAGPALIHFGSANQLGDVSIGPVAGRDIINLQITLQPGAQPTDASAAQPSLHDLPLDYLPAPASAPYGSRLPLGAYDKFVGRDDILRNLAAALKGDGGPRPLAAAVVGIGGVGKTQVAVEFASRYGRYFGGGVFWLNFADPARVTAEVAALARSSALGLAIDSSRPLEEQAEKVREAWRTDTPRLLIFDNCEDSGVLARERPPYGGCRVLVTSQRMDWRPSDLKVFQIEPLAEAESVELLRRLAPSIGADEAAAIAAELGHLPLALYLAGRYLDRYQKGVTPESYLVDLKRPELLDHLSLQGHRVNPEDSPTRHDPHVARTFRLSYERLDADDPTDALARDLLTRATRFVHGIPIPHALLEASAGPLAGPDGAPLLLIDALGRLYELGLLEPAPGDTVRLHRLLARYVEGVADAASLAKAGADVESAALALLMGELQLPQTDVEAMGSAAPHLRAITGPIFERNVATGSHGVAAFLQVLLDPHLMRWGEYRLILERHAQLAGRVRDRTKVPRLMSNRALAHAALGERHAALELLNNAQELASELDDEQAREEILADLLGEMGNLYFAVGAVELAARRFAEALAMARARGRASPAAKWLASLGRCLGEQGEIAASRARLEEALAMEARHPDADDAIAACTSGLALCEYSEGRIDEALRRYSEALALARRAHNRAQEAGYLNSVGACYTALGRRALAASYLREALALSQRLGIRQTEAYVLHSLAELLTDQARYDEAAELAWAGLALGEALGDGRIAGEHAAAGARARLLAGAVTAADEAIVRALQAEPRVTRPQMLAVAGVIAARAGRRGEAAARFVAGAAEGERLLARAPRLHAARFGLGLALAGRAVLGDGGSVAGARQAYAEALTMCPAPGLAGRARALLAALGPADEQGLVEALLVDLGPAPEPEV